MTRTIVVVTAGLRQPSSTRLLADKLGAATRRELEQRGADVDVETVEVRDFGHDLVNNLLVGYPSEALENALDRVARADGLVAVTPTFTASYNGLFKMFVDVLDENALLDKPVLIAATGGTGRHSLVIEHELRPLFAYLRAVTLPTGVFAAPEDWGSGGVANASLGQRVDRAAAELAREVERRESPTPAAAFGPSTSFVEMLGRH